MRVLITGASGFIGARIVAALCDAGHDVVVAMRKPPTVASTQTAIACDFARDTEAQIWEPRLAGIDAVVNCAGILREVGADTFQRIHVDAPLALFRACAALGVRRVVQISALGEDEDGEFIASKHRCDQALAGLELAGMKLAGMKLDWVVLRPGLVYSAHGAYGGTLLLRALAALPGVHFLPGDGLQKLQPIAAEDLAAAVVAVLARPPLRAEIIELVGPGILTFRDYLLAWRAWFGLPNPWSIVTPGPVVTLTVALGEMWGRGPLCRVIWNLLDHGRVGSAPALDRMRSMLGLVPVSLAQALAKRPCQQPDFLESRWYILRPTLICILVLLWIASGLVGLALPAADAHAALPLWPPALVQGMSMVASVMDLALGFALLLGWRKRLTLTLMLAMVLVYTTVIGLLAPAHWLDPFGGLLKNLPVMAILAVLLALEPRDR